MMPLQRACGAESQVRNKLSNGPRRAQSNVRLPHRVFCDVGTYVSCREYAVFRKEHGFAVNQGGTANKKSNYSSLADGIFLPRIFIYKGEKAK